MPNMKPKCNHAQLKPINSRELNLHPNLMNSSEPQVRSQTQQAKDRTISISDSSNKNSTWIYWGGPNFGIQRLPRGIGPSSVHPSMSKQQGSSSEAPLAVLLLQQPDPISDPKRNGNEPENGVSKDAAVAKTAGFVVLSGIATSILRALTPIFNAPSFNTPNSPKCCESPPPNQTPHQESKKVDSCHKPSLPKTIVIVKGDTLWGLSRKHGVSIDAIKAANGLSGDTIYAGKKLVIP